MKCCTYGELAVEGGVSISLLVKVCLCVDLEIGIAGSTVMLVLWQCLMRGATVLRRRIAWLASCDSLVRRCRVPFSVQ